MRSMQLGYTMLHKATSNGVVSAADLKDIHAQLQRVYEEGDYVGSLVVGGQNRPTAHEGAKHKPADWWQAFWTRYEKNSGKSRAQAIHQLKKTLGPTWSQQPEPVICQCLDGKQG